MLGALSGPDAMHRFEKATEITPDLALGFAQTHEWLQKRGTSLTEADVQELDRDLLKNWFFRMKRTL